jgi:signal transduction histidine kinase
MIIADLAPTRDGVLPTSSLGTPSRIALIDSIGNIVAVNKDWMTFAQQMGASLNRVSPGANYLDVCRQATASASSAPSQRALVGIQRVLKGELSVFAMDYSCETPSGLAHFRMDVTPINYGNARVAVSHTDITDLQVSKEDDLKRLQQFARRLINAQEDERRRLSREIHDDLGHTIALMSLSVRQVVKQYSKGSNSRMRDLNKVLDDIMKLSTSLRNLSHWLHPATLRYLGIPAALRSLRDGVEQAHDIEIDIVLPEDMPRLAEDVELCIFRITQESLQNITKHSGARKARIVLEQTPERICLKVSDNGRGFVRSEAIDKTGLGLLSMEERALSIGGSLSLESSPKSGTEVRLVIPMEVAGSFTLG